MPSESLTHNFFSSRSDFPTQTASHTPLALYNILIFYTFLLSEQLGISCFYLSSDHFPCLVASTQMSLRVFITKYVSNCLWLVQNMHDNPPTILRISKKSPEVSRNFVRSFSGHTSCLFQTCTLNSWKWVFMKWTEGLSKWCYTPNTLS